MSSNQQGDTTAAKMFGAVMYALKSSCECDACTALRDIGGTMIDALLKKSTPKKVRK